MAINLSRATKLFVSTVKTGNSTSNTWEVPTLDGYSFSQDAETQTITLNEAGETPVRGQKLFNIALNPADISIPTYVRPYYATGDTHNTVEKILWEAMVGNGKSPLSTTAAIDTNVRSGSDYMEANFRNSNLHELLKLYLYFQLDNTTYRIDDVAINSAEFDFSIDGIAQVTWNAQGESINEEDTSAWTAGTEYVGSTQIGKGSLDAEFIKNKLSTIVLKKTTGLDSAYSFQAYTSDVNPNNLANLDGASTYTVDITIDGGTLKEVSIDSSAAPWDAATVRTKDIIAEINYQLVDMATVYVEETGTNAGNLVFVSATAGNDSIMLVANGTTDLLGVLEADNAISGVIDNTNGTVTGQVPVVYNVPITGGTITVENNVTYLTPEELGKVNTPIGSFTGTRGISGTVTAYLNTGATNTGGLLTDLLGDTDIVTQEFEMTMSMGGGVNTPRVDFIMNHAALVIPTTNVEDVLSTEIGFTAQGETISLNDELVVRYVATSS